MDARSFLDIMSVAVRLKDATRHCYTPSGRRESVAEHSWRIALMAYFLKDEFPEADIDKVIKMCLIHDIGECFTGDIPTFLKTEQDEQKEEDLLYAWVRTLPEPYCTELIALYDEMGAQETLESRIYKSLDGLEALIAHNESDINTWQPHEYELNLTYCIDRVAFSEYLTALRSEIKADTEKKITEHRQAQ